VISKSSVMPSEQLGGFQQRVKLDRAEQHYCHGCGAQAKYDKSEDLRSGGRSPGSWGIVTPFAGYKIGTDIVQGEVFLCQRCAVDLALRILEAESL